jgi:hypothetical protein
VEGDLTETETVKVRSHLSACEACGHLSEEFAASQRRLRGFAAPQFDEEFYGSIRSAVLKEIKAVSAPRLGIFRKPFGALLFARPSFALSLMLLLGFVAAGGLLYNGLSQSDEARMAAFEKSFGEIKTGEYAQSPPLRTSTNNGTARRIEKLTGQRARVSSLASLKEPGGVNSSGASPRKAVGKSSDASAAAAPSETGINGAAATEGASAPEAVARMEIQTRDPNIRIIWLGRKSSE